MNLLQKNLILKTLSLSSLFSFSAFAGQGWNVTINNQLDAEVQVSAYGANCWYNYDLENLTVPGNSQKVVYTEESNAAGNCDDRNIFNNIPEKSTNIQLIVFPSEYSSYRYNVWFGRQKGDYIHRGPYGYSINNGDFNFINPSGCGGQYCLTINVFRDDGVNFTSP